MQRSLVTRPPWFGVPGGGRRLWSAALAAALFAVLSQATPARADLILHVSDVQARPGESGGFDVLLLNTNPVGGIAYNIAGASLELSVTGPAGVTFTAASIATSTPYLFVTSGTTQGGGPFSLDSFPNTLFLASDSEFAGPGYRTVGPGQSFGVAHVSYAIAPNAAIGDRSLVIGPGTSLTDSSGNSIAFTIAGGRLSVIPEPSVWMLVSVGGSCIFLVGRTRRWAAFG